MSLATVEDKLGALKKIVSISLLNWTKLTVKLPFYPQSLLIPAALD